MGIEILSESKQISHHKIVCENPNKMSDLLVVCFLAIIDKLHDWIPCWPLVDTNVEVFLGCYHSLPTVKIE